MEVKCTRIRSAQSGLTPSILEEVQNSRLISGKSRLSWRWLEVCHENATGPCPRERYDFGAREGKSLDRFKLKSPVSYGRTTFPYCFFSFQFFSFPSVAIVFGQAPRMLYNEAHDMASALDSGTSLGNTRYREYQESVQGLQQG